MLRFVIVNALALITLPAAVGCGGNDSSGTNALTNPAPTASAPVEPADEPPLPAGWWRYESQDFTIAFPERYIGGPAKEDATIAAVRNLGTGCAAVADLLESTPGQFEVVAVDRDTCGSASIRSVQVLAAPASATTPDAFIDEFVPGLPATAQLLERRVGEIGEEPAAIMRIERNYATYTTIQVIYGVRAGGSWQLIVAAATDSDFPAAAPDFDAIAATFRLK